MTLDKRDMKSECICYCLSKEGNYIIGNKYKWEYIIDGICVFDEEGKTLLIIPICSIITISTL